jgi:hypothetical protein
MAYFLPREFSTFLLEKKEQTERERNKNIVIFYRRTIGHAFHLLDRGLAVRLSEESIVRVFRFN